MEKKTNNPGLQEQNQPNKLHGVPDETSQKEKYIRDSGKIEDLPDDTDISKMKAEKLPDSKSESADLTDSSGEEKKEDYINTDERKRDLERRGS